MRKKIAILGSTGSIGVSCLDVIERNRDRFEVIGLTANNNIDLLVKQTYRFCPRVVATANNRLKRELRDQLNDMNITVLGGVDGVIEVAKLADIDLLVSAIAGAAGLLPTLTAIRGGKHIALANKEVLVMAGKLIVNEAKKNNVSILPIDSEHSAIFQSLKSGSHNEIKKLILTASGGPFHDYPEKQLAEVTPQQALKHPNWHMGKKVSVDSATMMNKGLEVMEAHWLFDTPIDKISVMVHPQSIVHSMVEYCDGSVIAQLGIPDMRIPISYALSYPERIKNGFPNLDLCEVGTLTFSYPDYKRFPCLELAYDAARECETMPAVLNAADEVAVNAFLKQRVRFADIPLVISRTMSRHSSKSYNTVEEIIEVDRWAREEAENIINSFA